LKLCYRTGTGAHCANNGTVYGRRDWRNLKS
jgi:hypothetical protein